MPYNQAIHQRRSIRLKGYDYSQAGAYFVTVVVQARENLFGEILNGEMQLNAVGEIVLQTWNDLPTRFPSIELDAFVFMPNHMHGIIVIGHDTVGATLVVARDDDSNRAGTSPAPTRANDDDMVGATLVVAHDDDSDRTNDDDTVGATLVVAHDTGTDDHASNTMSDHPTLGDVVGAFKSIVTDEYIRGVYELGWPPFDKRLWQRNYHEHIIRSETELNSIRRYIIENPQNWESDSENPKSKR